MRLAERGRHVPASDASERSEPMPQGGVLDS